MVFYLWNSAKLLTQLINMYYCTSYYRLANAAVHPQCFNFLVFIGQIDYSVLGGVKLSHKI